MRNQPFRWPRGRHLFDAKAKRQGVAVWIVMALSLAATILLAGICGQRWL